MLLVLPLPSMCVSFFNAVSVVCIRRVYVDMRVRACVCRCVRSFSMFVQLCVIRVCTHKHMQADISRGVYVYVCVCVCTQRERKVSTHAGSKTDRRLTTTDTRAADPNTPPTDSVYQGARYP